VYTAVCTARTRPCTRPVYGPYTLHVHGRKRPCRRARPCTRYVDGRKRAVYVSCTPLCARPVHGRVHGRVHVPCTGRIRSMSTAENVRADGPYTVMYTALVHGRYTAEYTGRYTAVYALCRRPKTAVYTAENGRAHVPYTALCTSRYGPYTAVYRTRYTAVYGRVDGRFRQCRWPVHGSVTPQCTRPLVHVDTCTQPYTCRVHRCVHGPYAAVYTYTLHVHGRKRPCRRPVHSHVHGWCRRAVCTAHTRPCTGRVYGTAVTAVYGSFSRAETCSRAVRTAAV